MRSRNLNKAMAIISHARYHELIRKEKALEAMKEKEAMAPFCEELCKNMGTLAALTPLDEWPKEFKSALHYARAKMPTAAAIYLARLPKGKQS